MRWITIGIIAALTIFAPATFAAGQPNVPPVLKDGFAAYKNKGSTSAIKTWLKGSPLEGSTAALSQANILNQVQDFYGKYSSYEILRVHPVDARTTMVLGVLDFEKGPLFYKFLLYKTKAGTWIVDFFMFNTEPEKVWPDDMTYGQ